MSTPVVPSLSLDGWVSNPPEMADYLLSHFFLSEYSQSQLWYKKVSSLPWIIQNNQGNMRGTVREMQDTLEKYFGAYFPQVTVEVTHDDGGDTRSKVDLHIFISVVDRTGKEHSVAKMVQVIESKINKIVNLNNTGSMT